jgi:membrane associated rhomboid family serine protease
MEEQYALSEKKRLLLSMLIPFIFICLMWLVKAVEYIYNTDLYFLGIYPLKAASLVGIITSPFIHADLKHLYNNTLPLLVLGTALFYFYSQVAFRVLLWLFLFTGMAVWLTGRPAWHIGASGIIYGLASFLFVSGIIRRHIPLMALSLLVVFLYGQMVWGIFPGLRPNISWESHMLGAAVGLFLAIWYRKEGPQKPVPFYEDEDEENEAMTAQEKDSPGVN